MAKKKLPKKKDNVLGQRIVAIRAMTPEEAEAEGWDRSGATVIELESGALLYPSRDSEGNGPGEVFGRDPNGRTFLLQGQYDPRRPGSA